jgi:hypothetical protein
MTDASFAQKAAGSERSRFEGAVGGGEAALPRADEVSE